MAHIETILAELRHELDELRAESAARRLLARYLYLCDSPIPEFGMDDEARVQAIGDLFADDAIWEGVGGAHGAQFGQHVGPAAITRHMRAFYGARNPRQVFNTHYLCSEMLHVIDSDTAAGSWVQFQPWIYDDGSSLIRSSRLHVRFRRTERGWKLAHYRTENLFIGKLPDHWADSRIEASVLMAPPPARSGAADQNR